MVKTAIILPSREQLRRNGQRHGSAAQRRGKRRREQEHSAEANASRRAQEYPRSSTLLKFGLACLLLSGLSWIALVRIRNADSTSMALLWIGWATLMFTVVAMLCLRWSFAFWADKKWQILSRWIWPKRHDRH